MKKHTVETIDPQKWWVQKLNFYRDLFPNPACEYAEGMFLSFILYIANNHSTQKNRNRVKNVSIFSYDGSKVAYATALPKETIKESTLLGTLLNRHQFYNFGEDTFLVLDGPLAGTIAAEVPVLGLQLFRQNKLSPGSTPVLAVRPFFNHSKIEKPLTAYKTEGNKLEAAHFAKTQKKLNPSKAVQTLTAWLELANIAHDKETILANSQIGYTLLQQLTKK